VTEAGQPFVAAFDWGTTSLRAWLLDRAGTVLAESRGDEGITRIAAGGYPDVLAHHLKVLKAPAALPVVICGMAGARQGWLEAPYLDVPCGLNGLAAQAVPVPGLDRDVRILPGLAQRPPLSPDVMRGEETQLLGLGNDQALVCIPGTHSKWITIRDGVVFRFATHMTGELFDVLSRHSILQHAIRDEAVDPASEAFQSGLAMSLHRAVPLTQALFSTRARGLVGDEDIGGKAWLSGILIGAEIDAVRNSATAGQQVTLLASGDLSALYLHAFASAGMACQIADAELASRRGLLRAALATWEVAA